MQIDTAIMQRTRPGKSGADLSSDSPACTLRPASPGEWELHHQGGATGYASREWRASPNETRKVQLHQAFAWNPSITGTEIRGHHRRHRGRLYLADPRERQMARGCSVEVDGNVIQRPDILRL